jgi:ferredoxin-NADP reductase
MLYPLKQKVQDFCNRERISNLLQTLLPLLLISISFYPAFAAQLAARKNLSYAIARGAGASLKLLLPFSFISMLRMINRGLYHLIGKHLRNSAIGDLFHKRCLFHKVLGSALGFLAGTHIIAHAITQMVGLFAIESITGILMMGILAIPMTVIPLLYASTYFKNRISNAEGYYSKFLLPHQLGWWGLLALFSVHTRDLRLMAWSLSILNVFTFDRIWEWTKSNDVAVKKVERIHDKMIIVEIDKPEDFEYQTGEKVYLAYPPDNAFMNKLHPYTIASSPEEPVLRFVISESGRWSQHLIQQLKVNDQIRVSPAFPTRHDSEAQGDKERLFITSGSGLAVTLAHLHDSKNTTPINIIHTTREPKEFALFNQYVANKKYPIKSVNYFDTSDTYRSKLRAKSAPGTSLHKGRFIPSQNNLLTQFKGQVVFCGNDNIGKALEDCIAKDKSKKLLREKF